MPFDLLWKGWLDWLFPVYCCGCANQRTEPKKPLCYQCLAELAVTRYAPADQIKLEKIFWGRIAIQSALAIYPLKPASVLQQTLHQLKYHHRPGIGNYLGRISGEQLKKHFNCQSFDALIPLPLHISKKRKRGYNQAEKICQGLSAATRIPVWNDIVRRNRSTESQTRKDRAARWENMKGKFSLKNIEKAKGKHLLLVDDVITTGATLEACGQTLLEIPNCRLSVLTIAHTETTC